MNKPLRFGIMCDGYVFKKWQGRVIESLISSGLTEPVLLIINENPAFENKTLVKKLRSYLNRKLLFKVYMRFVCKPDSLENIDLRDLLKDIPSISCSTQLKGKYSEYFINEDIEKIKEHNTDFILRFGFNIIRGEVLKVPKYGVWSYHHSDEMIYRGGTTGFWEIYKNDNVSGAALQRLTDKLDAGIFLKKGYFKTIKHSYSAQIDNLLYGCIDFPKQVCIDIFNNAAAYMNKPPSETKAPLYFIPNNLQMLCFFGKLFKNKLSFHYNELFFTEQWNIGVVKEPIQSLIYDLRFTIYDLNTKSKDIKWATLTNRFSCKADCFGYESEGKINILFEDFSYEKMKSSLGKIEFDDVSGFANERTLLEKTYHLSYPYIFKVDNELYCIPESYQNKQISLYKVDKATGELIFVKTLIDNISAIDSTIVFYNDKWWLFCTRKEHDSNTNLFVYYSDLFDGEYIPHANNPVKTDIRSARPAGTPFIYDSQLYRPSQNCSKTYGGQIVINRVEKISPFEFEEHEAAVIKSFDDISFRDGVHTISSVGDYCLIDVKRHRFVFKSFSYQLGRKIKRLFGEK